MRILGKGKTAQGIKELYPNGVMYDDSDKDMYDINSDELTVVSPGIPPYNYLVKNTKNKISDYDLFLEDIKAKTVWISGTNGKTTTTQMIYDLLKEDSLCGGNIGTPLAKISNIYNNKKDKYKQIILETSSFTLHYTNKVKPDIYILLPISDDHVSWHGSFKEYEKAKLKPLSMMPKNSVAVVPSIYKDIKTDALTYYYKDSSDLAGQFNIDTEKIKFNEPFLLDSLLALCVKKILTDEIDYETINEFVVDKHKVEEFRDSQNRLWVDDSKATNLDATVWALKGYKDKQINLILGGDDKGAELDPLFKEMKNYDIELFTIGSNSQKLGDLAQKYDILCNCFTNLKEAVDAIDKKMKTQNSLNTSASMLSPAAASLDQFESYKQRGEEFKNFVNSLEN